MRALTALGFCLLVGCAPPRQALPRPKTPLVASPASAKRPQPATEWKPQVVVPPLTIEKLANGMHLVMVPLPKRHTIVVRYVSRRGGAEGLVETAGVAQLTNDVLGESFREPRGRKARPLHHRLRMNWETWRHSSHVQLSGPPDLLPEAVATLADRVRTPAVTYASIENARDRFEDELADADDGASFVLQRLYGPTHILGQNMDHTSEVVHSWDPYVVQQALRSRHVPRDSAIVVSGPLDPEQVRQVVTEQFADWNADAKSPPRYKRPTWQPGGKRFLFLHNDRSPVASISIGQKVPGRASEDHAAMQLLVRVLAERLMDSLREELGAAYWATAYQTTRRDGGTLLLRTVVRRDSAERASRRMLAEMERLRREPITKDEMARVRAQAVEAITRSLEMPHSAADQMTSLFGMGIQPRDLLALQSKLNGLDPQTLMTVALRVLDPRGASIVVWGDKRGDLGRWAKRENEGYPLRERVDSSPNRASDQQR